MKLIPGMGALREKLGDMQVPEKEMVRIEAIINSMTPQERRQPILMNTSRKERIARGAGTTVKEVDKLLSNFEGMRQMMKQVMGGGKKKKGKMPQLPGMGGKGMPDPSAMSGMGGLPGMGGFPGMPGMPGMDGMQPSGPSKSDQKKKRDQRKKDKQKKKQGKKKR
jgi:signal recognition particle subunit SRP54